MFSGRFGLAWMIFAWAVVVGLIVLGILVGATISHWI